MCSLQPEKCSGCNAHARATHQTNHPDRPDHRGQQQSAAGPQQSPRSQQAREGAPEAKNFCCVEGQRKS